MISGKEEQIPLISVRCKLKFSLLSFFFFLFFFSLVGFTLLEREIKLN